MFRDLPQLKEFKARNYAMELYPDSMPDNAFDLLLNSDMSVAISPKHTPESDEKKFHYHVVISFDGPKNAYDIATRLMSMFHCPIPEIIDSKTQALRYLIHRGWPSKIQYPFETIQSNYDIRPYFADDIFVIDILELVENDSYITCYKKLIRKLYKLGKFDYLEKVAKNSYFFKCFFDE